MGRTLKPQPDAGCCVIGCVNYEFISDDERFYRFPTNQHQRNAWIDAVSKINGVDEDGVPWKPSNDSIICCKHFIKNYKARNPWGLSYIPTIFSSEAYIKKPRRPIDSFTININDESLEEDTPNAAPIQQLPETSSQAGSVSTYPFRDKKEIQAHFIDHIVMSYLNRCRSRAGRINIGMPPYIFKDKAEQAAVLLGANIGSRFEWFEKFKKKLAKNNAKEIVLTSHTQSLIVADIMIDEWPIFAKLKGLNIGDNLDESVDGEEDLLQMERAMTETIDNSDQTQIQINNLSSHCSKSIHPPMEEEGNIQITSERQIEVKQEVNDWAAQTKFLKHVLNVFIRRFNATFPEAELPDSILNEKYTDAALFLGQKVNTTIRNEWKFEYKRSLLAYKATELISEEPNQSLQMYDIIEEERPKFCFQNDDTPRKKSKLEDTINSVVKTEPKENSEDCDGIQVQTYEEARDCLSLLNNYALELGDISAFSLIRQIDTFLRSEDCED